MINQDELSSLLQGLSDPDPSTRRIAAEGLSGADERAIYPLICALKDDNPGVQDAATRSLVELGGEVTAYMTLPLLRETPFLRNTARLVLRQIGRTSVPLLRRLLADKEDDIRTFAVDLIADIGWCDYPDAIARLLETDPNQNVRASAARAVGALDFRGGLPALFAALGDDEWVSFSALESLAVMKDEASVDPITALLGSPSETLRYAAIEALGKIGSSRSSGALLGRLQRAGDIEKTAIIRSLVLIGVTPAMEEVADLLMEMFTHDEWEERLIALAGLADLKYKRAVPLILDTAGALDPSEPESEDRLYAVKQALLKFECLPALTSVVADPAFRFRAKVLAIEVIAELQCADSVPLLVSLLTGDLREVRRAAAAALARIGGDDALAALRACTDDRDGHVRSAAISELGLIGDRASFDPLLKRLGDERYPDVREETVRALLRIDPQRLSSMTAELAPDVRELVARYTGGSEHIC
jgi:HEAT repeat protein